MLSFGLEAHVCRFDSALGIFTIGRLIIFDLSYLCHQSTSWNFRNNFLCNSFIWWWYWWYWWALLVLRILQICVALIIDYLSVLARGWLVLCKRDLTHFKANLALDTQLLILVRFTTFFSTENFFLTRQPRPSCNTVFASSLFIYFGDSLLLDLKLCLIASLLSKCCWLG